MLQNCVQIQNTKSINVFVHTVDSTHRSQKINLLTITTGELPKMISILDVKQQSLISMQKFEDSILTLDEAFFLRRYKFSKRLNELRMYQESELIDTAQITLKIYGQNISSHIAINDTEVYIGSRFYQNYANLQTNRDANTLFERHRNNRIGKMSIRNMVKGPISSVDQSRLVYLRVYRVDKEGKIIKKKRKDNSKSNQAMSNKEGAASKGNQSTRQGGNSTRSIYGQNKQGAQSMMLPDKNAQNTSRNQSNASGAPYELDNFGDAFKWQPRVRKGKHMHFLSLYSIPYLGSRTHHLMHKDDYLYHNVQFSTFTIKDHVLIMIDHKVYIFSQQGIPLLLEMTEEVECLLGQEGMEIQRISSSSLYKIQTFLFLKDKNYYLFKLDYKGKSEHIFLSQKQRDVYTLKLVDTYQQLLPTLVDENDKEFYYSAAKQDSEGNLYQVLAELVRADRSYRLKVTRNGERQVDVENVLKAMSENIKLEEAQISQEEKQPAEQNGPQLPLRSMSAQVLETDQERLTIGRGNPAFQSKINEQLEINKELKLFNKLNLDFEILHARFMVMKVNLKIFYMDMLACQGKEKLNKVDLILRPGQITQLLQTQVPHLLQFVYVQREPNIATYIMTWNLLTNMEDQMLELPLKCYDDGRGGASFSEENSANCDYECIKVRKGVSERLNYFIPQKTSYFFDLRYNFPLNYFSGISACLKLMQERSGTLDEIRGNRKQERRKKESKCNSALNRHKYIDELKFSSNAISALGLTRECVGTVIDCYSYLDYQYMQYLLENDMQVLKGEDEEHRIQYLLMALLRFRLEDGSNILHILPTHEKFLHLYTKIVNFMIDEMEVQEGESFYFSVIYPNNKGQTPLDIAIHERASRSVEIMLEMLSSRPSYNFSKYIQKHFYTLLEMKSVSFEHFLEGCSMKISLSFKNSWKFPRDTRQFAFHSSYLDENFIRSNFSVEDDNDLKLSSRQLNKSTTIGGGGAPGDNIMLFNQINLEEENPFAKEEEQSCAFMVMDHDNSGFEYETSHVNLFDPKRSQSQSIENQTIYFEAIEFPWVFHGRSAKSFIAYLEDASSKGSRLFSNKIVQHIILFQWRHFRKSLIYFRLIPFIIYFFLIVFYITLTHEKESIDNVGVPKEVEEEDGTSDTELVGWNMAHRVMGSIIIVWTFYFLLLEFVKVLKTGFHIQMIPEWLFIFLTLTLVIINFAGASDTQFRIISVFILGSSYMHFILYLRLFDSTAVLVSMIYYITKEILVFLVVFIISVIAFANMFYVMQGVALNLGEEPEAAQLVGSNFMLACLNTFNAAFGNFSPNDNFGNYGPHIWILWLIYIILLLVLQLIMLNMIIAIMGDTYDQVMQIQKEERLKAKCRLIHENEFIFSRYRLFKDYRYIIIASLDKVDEDNDDWEGKIKTVVTHMDSKFQESHERQLSLHKMISTNERGILSQMRNQDHKMNDIATQLSKIQMHLDIMESQKKIQELMVRSGTKIKEKLQEHFVNSRFKENLFNKNGIVPGKLPVLTPMASTDVGIDDPESINKQIKSVMKKDEAEEVKKPIKSDTMKGNPLFKMFGDKKLVKEASAKVNGVAFLEDSHQD